MNIKKLTKEYVDSEDKLHKFIDNYIIVYWNGTPDKKKKYKVLTKEAIDKWKELEKKRDIAKENWLKALNNGKKIA